MNGVALGRVFGIPLRLETSAFLVLAMLGLGSARGGPMAMFAGLLYAVAVFASILVHELGHALAARRAGLGVVEIVLHGFGGLTRFTRPPNPRTGVGITLAGPGAGLALGAVAFGLFLVGVVSPVGVPRMFEELLVQLATINLFWSLFNLVPMYPLDGGQVLYYLLARRMPAGVAMRNVAIVGLVAAVLVAVAGLVTQRLFLVVVAALSGYQCFSALRGSAR